MVVVDELLNVETVVVVEVSIESFVVVEFEFKPELTITSGDFDPTRINQSRNPNITSNNKSEITIHIFDFFLTGKGAV